MTEKELFDFFQYKVKAEYAEHRASTDGIATEYLVEVAAEFEHLTRKHNDQECINKAYGHLKRALLDLWKIKLQRAKEYIKEIKKVDVSIIDNGDFKKSLLTLERELKVKAKEARLTEKKELKEGSFEKWEEVSVLIDRLEEEFYLSCKIGWAKKKSFFKFFCYAVVSILLALISSYLTCK